MNGLDRMFQPRSIAIVGASDNEDKLGFHLLYALRKFPGAMYPINSKAKIIQGLKAYPNLKAVGQPVDMVALCIPARGCLEVIKEAGETGAGAVFVTGGGFGEADAAGKAMQDELVASCRRYGVRLLGPNTSGFVNPRMGVTANFNPLVSHFKPGSIGVVSQSGAVNVVLCTGIQSNGLGISVGVGLGNASDIGVPEVLDYLSEHDETRVIAVYLEGVTDGRALYKAIYRATQKKPVVIFTVGQTDVGEFAVAHTGKLIGSFAIKKAALKQAGAVVVSSSNELIDAANILSKVRLAPHPEPGVGIITGQAGPAMIMTDYLRRKSVRIPELDTSTIERISGMLPVKTFIKNPVDTARPLHNIFLETLSIVAEAPNIDVLLAYAMHEPMCVESVPLFRSMKSRTNKPIVFATSGLPEDLAPELRDLETLDVPVFVSPDRAAAATRTLIEDAKTAYYKRRHIESAVRISAIDALVESPNEAEAKDILDKMDIDTPHRAVCDTHKSAIEAFGKMNKPCVVKILSEAVTHKTEVMGVHLNLETDGQLKVALKRIDAIDAPGGKMYLLEEMAPEGLEVIIGARRDVSFGPAVMIGLGGTAAEALGDVSMRLAPITTADALDMISELKTGALFDGWRGGPMYDKNAVADVLVKIGYFMTRHTEVKEMDLNPIRVYEKGILVLDALVICE
ncbi:MAG: acetate--CoA ligase family protein [Deltaproteobacteria bacterium]|nr:acetate--CoA ligase family protein [Deltaproteobacteria bacterium]